MKKSSLLPLFAALFACALFSLAGVREMITPDETRYGEIAREMLMRKDWITPYLNGVVYFEKPVFGHWCNAIALYLFSETPFGVRFSAVLFTLLTAAAMSLYAGRMRPGEVKFCYLAFFACILTPFTFIFAQVAVLDPIFTFFVTLSIVLFRPVTQEPWSRRGIACQMLTGAAIGLGFLTKGFLAYALPASAFFFYYVIPGQWQDWKTGAFWKRVSRSFLLLPWIPFAVSLAVIAPWAIVIHRAQPEFWHYFLYEEHFQRFFQQVQHPEPFWYFLPVLAAGLGYWFFFMTDAVKGLRKKMFSADSIRYLLCWAFGPLLFLSCSSGKLGTYILPCFPPLSLLLAAGLFAEAETDTGTVRRPALNFFLWCFCGAAFAGILVVPVVNHLTGDLLWNGEKLFFLLLLLAVVGIASLTAVKAGCLWKKLSLFGMGAGFAALMWGLTFPDILVTRTVPSQMIQAAKQTLKITPSDVIFCFRYPFQAVCWELKRDDVRMFDGAGELDRGIAFMRAEHRVYDLNRLNKFLQDPVRKERAIFFLPTSYSRELKGKLTAPDWSFRLSEDRKGYTALVFEPYSTQRK